MALHYVPRLYCGYTAGLEATGKALGLPQDKQKLNTGKALIRYFCIPCKPSKANGQRTRNLPQHDPAKWELFKTYCKQDVVTEMEIERRLSAFPVPDWVQKQWETDLIINARGVAVDLELVTGASIWGTPCARPSWRRPCSSPAFPTPTAWPSSPHGSRRRLVRSWPICARTPWPACWAVTITAPK